MLQMTWPRRDLLKSPILGVAMAAAPQVPGLAQTLVTPAAGDDPTRGRTLAFDENFNRLDAALWDAGPKATVAAQGFYGRSAFARLSGEAGFNPYRIIADPQATGGTALQIGVRYIGTTLDIPNYYGNAVADYQWVSGNLQTASRDGSVRAGWRNGYFEARMRFPAHPLTWPAFWLLNKNSILDPATSIEVDIVEHKGFERQLYGTYLHEWGDPGQVHQGSGVAPDVDLTSGYFRYGFLIDGDRCAPFFERRRVLDSKTGRPIDWPLGRAAEMDRSGDVFWPLLTLALRTDVPFPTPLRDKDREAHMRVDYVRVYT